VSVDRYRQRVREELEALGVRPRPDSDPRLVRAHLNDLYTFELRRLRAELVAAEASVGRKLRRQYSERVMGLRRKYALLSQPVESWTQQGAGKASVSAPC
jgi:hypothetical protein